MTTRARLLIVSFYIALIACFLVLLYGIAVARNEAQRGIWFPGEPLPPRQAEGTLLGTTVELGQYESETALREALDAAEEMGIGWLRQELPWNLIEPLPGQYEWERWDRVIDAAHARGFRLILVLNGTPSWARQPDEQKNPFAPPADPAPFVRFARAAARRYGPQVEGWQIWDEPNLMPHWGTEILIEPAEYAAFLAAVAPAVREEDPDGLIATAGLAPTGEPGGFNMSELRFLAGLYEAGAAAHFDVVALKAYGFWTGAEERFYHEEHLSFDRVVLVREVMERYGDGTSPLWLVEGGWAALPADWAGEPPPWGSDRPEVQQARLERAIRRATLEWPWVHLIALQPLQPDVPPGAPRSGLALLEDGRLSPLGESTRRMATLLDGPEGEEVRGRWERIERPALRGYDRALWLVIGMLGLLAIRLLWHGWALPWSAWGAWFRQRPEWLQAAALFAVALAFYLVDNRGIALLLYGALGILIAWRFDLGMAAIAFSIPFFLQPKQFGGLHFSMLELLLLLAAFVWVARPLAAGEQAGGWVQLLRRLFWPEDRLDWAILLFALWAALSIPFAQYFGVAVREFRVVIAEPVIWFWLIRRVPLDEVQRRRLLDALVLAGTLVALYGLYQWFFTDDIIRAEGVRRVRALYGSPNNLALLLERLLPLAGALFLLAPPSPRRVLYGLATLPLALCLFLTFSRGAWLLGMPAALFWLAWWGGARSRRWAVGAVVVSLLLLLPFLSTERIASAGNLEGGTWFIRFRLWEATVAMIQDFPLLGVGLDNFLYVYESYRLPEAWREPDLSHPHQIFLHFWVALGLPGLLLLAWQQWEFWRCWRMRMKMLAVQTVARSLLIGLGAGMVAGLTHGLIDNSYFLVDLAFVWMMTIALTSKFGEVSNG